MVARSKHRGHPMYFDKELQRYRYEDDDSFVDENWEDRPCGHCGKYTTEEGHDPCIANLPGVRNACCGHGNDEEAYVQFEGGGSLRGIEAKNWMENIRHEEAGQLF